jgi:hypothetical protein
LVRSHLGSVSDSPGDCRERRPRRARAVPERSAGTSGSPSGDRRAIPPGAGMVDGAGTSGSPLGDRRAIPPRGCNGSEQDGRAVAFVRRTFVFFCAARFRSSRVYPYLSRLDARQVSASCKRRCLPSAH